jgi:hypothetical protein
MQGYLAKKLPNDKKLGQDQLELLREILMIVQPEFSSIIVGTDANQDVKNSASKGHWTEVSSSFLDPEAKTVKKKRTFMQHQWAKVGKTDDSAKDYVLLLKKDPTNAQCRMNSAQVSYLGSV